MALSLTPLQWFTLNAARSNLISANKEGLVSLTGKSSASWAGASQANVLQPGYLAIHLLGLSVGTVLLPPSPSDFRRQQAHLRKQIQVGGSATQQIQHTKPLRRQDDKTAIELFSYSMLWWTCLGLCYVFAVGGGISRRLVSARICYEHQCLTSHTKANMSYVLWVTAFNTTFILCYLLLDIAFSLSPSRKGSERLQPSAISSSKDKKAPALLEAINMNSLTLFLIVSLMLSYLYVSLMTIKGQCSDWSHQPFSSDDVYLWCNCDVNHFRLLHWIMCGCVGMQGKAFVAFMMCVASLVIDLLTWCNNTAEQLCVSYTMRSVTVKHIRSFITIRLRYRKTNMTE